MKDPDPGKTPRNDAPAGDAAGSGPPGMPRPLRLDRLARNAPRPFDETASEVERASIAGLLEARSVGRLRFSGRLVPEGERGWRLEGRLQATIVQACVITLEDVATRLDLDLRRRYRPDAEERLEVDPEEAEEEETEPLPARLDLGAVAIEAASLALDPWPRRPGASLADRPEAGDPPDAEERPFAGLAALKARMERGS